MPSENKQSAPLLSLKRLDVKANLDFPVIPGTPFAVLDMSALPKGVKAADACAMVPPEANIAIDPGQGAIAATIPGMVQEEENGLIVKPLWTLSKDQTLLAMDVYAKDAFGDALEARALKDMIGAHVGEVDFDIALLEQALAKAREEGKPLTGVFLAQGQPAKDGKPGTFKKLFREANATGSIREDGSLDYRERGETSVVNPGDLIAELRPPTAGVAGKDVFGQAIQPKDGEPVLVKAGKNVDQEQGQGGMVVFKAASMGVPIFDGSTLSVSDLLEIETDVDISTGNVHLDAGSVLIKGTVTTGAKVTAKDNVIIEGVVENADITAGGDVTIKGGVLMDEGASIKAGGNVQAKFFRNATVRAVGNVVAEVDIVNSDIQAGGKVVAASENGAISGGTIVCGLGLDTMELGNDSFTPTSVTVKPAIEELRHSDKAMEYCRRQLKQLDRYIGVDNALNALLLAAEEDKRILSELFKLKGKFAGELREHENKKEELLKQNAEALAKIRIQARKTAFPGVSITIVGKRITLNEPKQASRFHWHAEKGGIAISGL